METTLLQILNEIHHLRNEVAELKAELKTNKSPKSSIKYKVSDILQQYQTDPNFNDTLKTNKTIKKKLVEGLITEVLTSSVDEVAKKYNKTPLEISLLLNITPPEDVELPSNSRKGQRWTPVEDQQLLDLLKAGQDFDSIAKKHGRSVISIKLRLQSHFNKLFEDKTTTEIADYYNIAEELVDEIMNMKFERR